MNAIAKFRKCTLSNDELLRRVDEGTDNLYKTREIPGRHVPARPDRDYDLLVGELVLRFQELEAENKRLREVLEKVNHAIYFSNMRGTILHLEVRNALNPQPPKEQ